MASNQDFTAGNAGRGNTDVIDVVNGLIETCKDGENGFRSAAEGVEDGNLKRLFQSYSQQRAEFAAELEAEVRRAGDDPSSSGHVLGTIHRGWINIKAAVTGKDEGAIIAECERGEDVAVRNYREALEKPLPADLRAIIERQNLQVQEAHDHIRSLERAHEKKS
ncbi:MAG: ferritin-like domain-containing protein [Gemmatimonadales bacterium]